MKLVLSILALLAMSSGVFGQTMTDMFPESKLTASDGAVGDNFGYKVSISGDYAVMGAYRDDDNGSTSGSAYVFERDGAGVWSEVQKLTASDGADNDYFGISVSISGDYAVIGAYTDDDNGANSGSAYIFERDGAGNWSEVQKLTASDAAASDYFGRSVSISGNTVVIGVDWDDDNGSNSGSAYVFERGGAGNWSEVQKLTASDGAANDFFGRSVSISGETVVVGAYNDDDNGSSSGSAYVFERDGFGNWSEVLKLTASDGALADSFGLSVSVSGDYAVIGAYGDDDNGSASGSAYVFERDGAGNWSEVQKLTASDAAENDEFGWSVSISGDYAVIGAYLDDSGSAYVFKRSGSAGNWSEVEKLTASDGAGGDRFGYAVSIVGNTVVVGADGDDDNGGNSGSAYMFDLNSVLNLDYGNRGYGTLQAAVNEAVSGDRLAVRSNAFDVDGIVNLSSMPLTFIAVEPIEMGADLMLLPADGTSFVDSGDVDQAGWILSGQLIAPESGSLVISSFECANGAQLHQNTCSLFVDENFGTNGGVSYLSGDVLAVEVNTGVDGAHRIIGDTRILGDYVNAGTTSVHLGTLYIVGDLTDTGTMAGNYDTGPVRDGGRSGGRSAAADAPQPGDGLNIGGHYQLGADASLTMSDFDWTLAVGGDLDIAINDHTRFAMSGSTFKMTGLSGGDQLFELMSLDVGEDADGFDPSLPGSFPVGTFRVASGSTVNLADNHDNAGDGSAVCEALYASNIIVEAGATLSTGGCAVYTENATINGTVDGEIIIIDTSCPGDATGDLLVNLADFTQLLIDYGTTGESAADFNGDNIVDLDDFSILLVNFGNSCQ